MTAVGQRSEFAVALTRRLTGDAPALVYDGRRIDNAGLGALAGEAAEGLRALGLVEGEAVCVSAATSPEIIALVIACAREGHPVLLPAGDLPVGVLREVMDRVGCRYALAAGARIEVDTGAAARSAATTAPLLLTTSGSTGTPKVVPIVGDVLRRFFAWASSRFGVGPGRTVFAFAPLNFDLSLFDVWTTLASGGQVVIPDRRRVADSAYLAGLVRSERVDVVQAVPVLFSMLASTGDPFDCVDTVMWSGDLMPLPVLRRLPELFPNARLYDVYGCTEINDAFVREIPAREAVAAVRSAALGEPVLTTQVVVLAADGTELTGPGRGELLVSTPFQTPGYLDPSLDAEKFSVRRGVRYFRPGDLVVRAPDGELSLDGREDFQVKVRGVRVNPAEVEQALLAHPEVAEAGVAAVPDEFAGHLLHALVRRVDGSTLTSLVLRTHCAALLPRSGIPSSLVVTSDPLPRTTSGKVDRRRIGAP
ncbi:AMP-binding protein [Lentzea sp. NPDC055074]